MKIILIDNYDSFTFNLYHYISSLGVNVEVIRNDEKIGRAHVWTPVTSLSRMPSSAWKKKTWSVQ